MMLRERAQAAVDRLINLLDAIDGDPDLEDSDGDACAAEDMSASDGCMAYPGDSEDVEDNHDAEAHTAEDEGF